MILIIISYNDGQNHYKPNHTDGVIMTVNDGL